MITWYTRTNIQKCARDASTSGHVVKTYVGGLDMASVSQPPICGIYKITNMINGMCYIGQSRDIEGRWAQHRQNRGKDHNYYLIRDIRKYGIEKFSFEVLEKCDPSKLDELEKNYIIQFDSLEPNGYNLEKGGNTNKNVTVETRKRMSLAWKHRPPFTEETRRKMSLSREKPISQFDKGGFRIATYQSLNRASKTIGIPAANITECCKGRRKSAGGFMWRYATSGDNRIKPISYLPRGGTKIPVSQFNIEGTLIAIYESGQEASSATGVSRACISACCREKQKTAGGFIWRYVERETIANH